MIFIIELLNLILIYNYKNVQQLKWKQEIKHQNNYYKKDKMKNNIMNIQK